MSAWTKRIMCVVAALACTAGGVLAVEVWTPETGEVELERLPRDTAQLRRQHALALIGAGQWVGGVAELRELMAADPDGQWVTEAQFAMARGLVACGQFGTAFDELERLRIEQQGTPLAQQARTLQFTAADLQAAQEVDAALKLYDRLIDTASSAEEAAYAQKQKADAAFSAGRYLAAKDEYMALATLYPYSRWVPYCMFRMAECEWEIARWLRLGLEGVQRAEWLFVEFVETYPAHAYTGDAKEKLTAARSIRADMYREIARFYIETRKRPWAAVNYLSYIRQEFADMPEAEKWATEELARIRREAPVPLRGQVRPLELPGVRARPRGD